MRDCENCYFYDDYTLTSCCHKECDDLIEAAEAAFDEYLNATTNAYSELCSVRAQSRK